MTDHVSSKKWKRPNRFATYASRLRLHITDSGLILTLSFMTGLLSGICAFLLKYLIATISGLLTRGLAPDSFNLSFIIMPVIGIVITALFCRYAIKDNVANGVNKLMADINNKKYRLKSNTIYGSIIASAFTLGFGGSAGSEGPIAYAGAGIGSRIGQTFKIPHNMMPALIGCGAAAGIAGIFKSPIGGALFTLEILRIRLNTVTVMGIFIATVTSALTAYILSGYSMDIHAGSLGHFDPSTIIWLFPLGVICGLYSLYYTWTGSLAKRKLCSCRNSSLKYIASGAALGLMIFVLPSLFGEGYSTITDIIDKDTCTLTRYSIFENIGIDHRLLILILCSGILLLKGIGSSVTNNGGGVAGDFAPTLFAGCVLGLMFSSVINDSGIATLDTSHFALTAMAGAMAGIIRAPLMAMFIVTEMVGGFDFLLPVAIVSLVSYGIVMIFKHDTFYHSHTFK
ncbi:MAG: chloride channel protein [Muribaculaceae bacterium]|nr:chloride channel protein [Muribaculaceae bacterium]